MEQSRLKYSILLPVHNGAATVEFAIRSALLQTVSDFELLVVGDGCTDRSADVVRSISDARIQWFDMPKAPNRGYANRNRVLRAARGEVVAYLQQDDLWLPDHLERLGAGLARPGVEWAYSRPVRVLPEGLLWPHSINLNDEQVLKQLVNRRGWLGFPETFVAHRRQCLEVYGYWNEALITAGDLDLYLRFIAGGGGSNFTYLPEPTALHFQQPGAPPPPARSEQKAAGIESIPALQLPARTEIPLQQVAWELIAAAPAGWTASTREAVQCWLDRQLILCHLDGHYSRLAELDAGLNSAGWRLVTRIRQIRWRLAVPGSARERIWLTLLRALERQIGL